MRNDAAGTEDVDDDDDGVGARRPERRVHARYTSRCSAFFMQKREVVVLAFFVKKREEEKSRGTRKGKSAKKRKISFFSPSTFVSGTWKSSRGIV